MFERRPRTQSERRQVPALATLRREMAEEYGVHIRPARRPSSALPGSWSGKVRVRTRTWKRHRRTQWR